MLLAVATLLGFVPSVKSTDTAEVAVLEAALARVEAIVATELGLPGTSPTWASTSTVLRLQGLTLEPRQLILPYGPVTAIASVYQDLNLAFAAATLVASTDYEHEQGRSSSILHLLPTGTTAAWYTAERSVKVTCTIGYANEAAIPKGLAGAVYQWVADWWHRRGHRLHQAATGSGNSVSFAELEPVPADVARELGKWACLARFA